MFPLGTVLVPSMVMPLHIFEPRYRALARRCLEGDRRFGVVLIERGSEVGGGDVRCGVGTRAEVVQAAELDDGRWLMAVVGVDRIRVDRWLADDPYPRAEVTPLPGRPPGGTATDRRKAIERTLRRVLALRAELGEPSAPATVELDDDPDNAAWQAVVLAPLGAFDSQRVLEVVDADDRLDLVAALLEDEALLLAQRVAGG
ncbi:MAG: ATP-dependent Lon protease [Actinomycetota bacterium]|nr:ATP-dependent Lon protease [Actinomycetota bacterium]